MPLQVAGAAQLQWLWQQQVQLPALARRSTARACGRKSCSIVIYCRTNVVDNCEKVTGFLLA